MIENNGKSCYDRYVPVRRIMSKEDVIRFLLFVDMKLLEDGYGIQLMERIRLKHLF